MVDEKIWDIFNEYSDVHMDDCDDCINKIKKLFKENNISQYKFDYENLDDSVGVWGFYISTAWIENNELKLTSGYIGIE